MALSKGIIIGIDPGLVKTGWGVISFNGQSVTHMGSGTIKTNAKDGLAYRLQHLCVSLQKVVDQFSPTEAAIEETFVNKNAQSSLKLGHARGALIATLAHHDLPPAEYAPRLVKQSVTGTGRAEKHQIATMIQYMLPGSTPDSEDAADALAIALCHAHHRNTIANLTKVTPA